MASLRPFYVFRTLALAIFKEEVPFYRMVVILRKKERISINAVLWISHCP